LIAQLDVGTALGVYKEFFGHRGKGYVSSFNGVPAKEAVSQFVFVWEDVQSIHIATSVTATYRRK
jgi:hypothetical protein